MLLVSCHTFVRQQPAPSWAVGAVAFAAHSGLPPEYSHGCWTPWSVFQDGSDSDCELPPLPPRSRLTAPPLLVLRDRFDRADRTGADRRLTPQTGLLGSTPENNTNSLPWEQFHALFTPFSRFFSSFPHGTCLLSVSCLYLALDGLYHPLWAAFPSNPTRSCRLSPSAAPTGLSPSQAVHSRTLDAASDDHTPGLQFAFAIPNSSTSRFTRRYWGNPC